MKPIILLTGFSLRTFLFLSTFLVLLASTNASASDLKNSTDIRKILENITCNGALIDARGDAVESVAQAARNLIRMGSVSAVRDLYHHLFGVYKIPLNANKNDNKPPAFKNLLTDAHLKLLDDFYTAFGRKFETADDTAQSETAVYIERIKYPDDHDLLPHLSSTYASVVTEVGLNKYLRVLNLRTGKFIDGRIQIFDEQGEIKLHFVLKNNKFLLVADSYSISVYILGDSLEQHLKIVSRIETPNGYHKIDISQDETKLLLYDGELASLYRLSDLSEIQLEEPSTRRIKFLNENLIFSHTNAAHFAVIDTESGKTLFKLSKPAKFTYLHDANLFTNIPNKSLDNTQTNNIHNATLVITFSTARRPLIHTSEACFSVASYSLDDSFENKTKHEPYFEITNTLNEEHNFFIWLDHRISLLTQSSPTSSSHLTVSLDEKLNLQIIDPINGSVKKIDLEQIKKWLPNFEQSLESIIPAISSYMVRSSDGKFLALLANSTSHRYYFSSVIVFDTQTEQITNVYQPIDGAFFLNVDFSLDSQFLITEEDNNHNHLVRTVTARNLYNKEDVRIFYPSNNITIKDLQNDRPYGFASDGSYFFVKHHTGLDDLIEGVDIFHPITGALLQSFQPESRTTILPSIDGTFLMKQQIKLYREDLHHTDPRVSFELHYKPLHFRPNLEGGERSN